MYGLVLSLLVSAATGYVLVCLLWPGRTPAGPGILLKLSLAVGIGLGLSSCTFLVFLMLGGMSVGSFAALELVLLACPAALLAALLLGRGRRPAPLPDAGERARSWTTWTLSAVFVLLLAAGVMSFWTRASRETHGHWDAWADWNLRARFVFRGGEHWPRAFAESIPFGQGSYPPLVTVLVARCWKYAGSDTLSAPAIVAFASTFGIVALGSSSLCLLRGRSSGLFAGVVLLATPCLLRQGPSQYADVPLAFFFLAAIVLLALHRRCAEGGWGLLALAGMACGLAVCTKHEGIAFLLWLAVIGVVRLARAPDRKRSLREVGAFCAGLLPLLVVFVWFKAVAATGKSHVSDLTLRDVLDRLCDVSRYLKIAWAFLPQLWDLSAWGALPIILPFYLLVSGVRIDERDRAGVRGAVLLLALTLFTYAAVYLVTPWDLNWLVAVTRQRLVLHLWPAAVFVFFLVVRAPEEAVSRT